MVDDLAIDSFTITNDNIININVFNLVESNFCVATENARKLFDVIFQYMKEDKKTIVSFNGIKLITPLFFNMSICQLYNGQFKEDDINNYLEVVDLNERDERLLSYQIKKAKRYFKDPEKYNSVLSHILEDCD
jgi:STAS-like domain of unknown function (DUF4325)